ncbi:MAG: amidase [Myxococcales bacterium]|nr:amidase [Myxococcales bacterium]
MRIHELGATELRDKLDRGELSAREIVDALHARAEHLNPSFHAIVVDLHEAAVADANRADQERARGEANGALHGIPITVKESLDIAGVDTTLGFPGWRGRPATEDAVVVDAARAAGAIVLGKTNVPQSLLSPLETTNPIWGTTPNPWNAARAPGGSSGGEAVSLASGMSPLGLGTDVGGSIRLPAAFTGTAGLKPTAGRWSNVGSRSSIGGQEFVRAQVGPMARNARDVAFLFGALDVGRMAARDGAVPPLPIARPDHVDLGGLTVGFYETDGFIEPSPSVRRAVREAVKAIEARGARVVEYTPPHADDLLYLYLAAVSADGGAHVRRHLAGDSIIDPLKLVKLAADMPSPARRALARTMSLAGEKRIARLLEAVGAKDVDAFWSLTRERDAMLRDEQSAWDAAKLDAVICPAQTTPAVGHGQGKDFILSFTYAARYNFLNRPAGVVPVTCVRPGEEQRPDAKDRFDKRAQSIEAKSEGLPIGVQVVGRAWREDVVLALMIAIEDTAREHPDFPKTPITPNGHSLPPTA